MTVFWSVVFLFAFVAFYAVWLRPAMRKTPWGSRILDKIEPIERVLWRKSETILFGRFLQALGVLLSGLQMLGSIDLTPLVATLPEPLQARAKLVAAFLPLLSTMIGWLIEQLRKDITKPIEVVEMRTDAPVEAKMAAAEAAVANAQAVEMIKETGAV